MDTDDLLHSQNKNVNVKVTIEGQISGYFCSDTVFNLNHRVLTETEIKLLEKGLDYAPNQKKISDPELRKDFSEFCRRIRNKWYFWNEPTPQFSEIYLIFARNNKHTQILTVRNGRPCVL